MPEKNPDIWAAITAQMYQYFIKHDAIICVAVGVSIVNVLKMLSDKRRDTIWGIAANSSVAGIVVLGAGEILDNFGYDRDHVYTIGIILCLFGVDFFRSKIIKWAKKHGFLSEDD